MPPAPKEITTGIASLGQAGALWLLNEHEGVRVTGEVRGEAVALTISRARGANWHGELCYAPFPVTAGARYTVSFTAKALHPCRISVWLGQYHAPHQSLVPEANHFGEVALSTQWTAITHRWHPHLSEENARLVFALGAVDNLIEIKQITLTRA